MGLNFIKNFTFCVIFDNMSRRYLTFSNTLHIEEMHLASKYSRTCCTCIHYSFPSSVGMPLFVDNIRCRLQKTPCIMSNPIRLL